MSSGSVKLMDYLKENETSVPRGTGFLAHPSRRRLITGAPEFPLSVSKKQKKWDSERVLLAELKSDSHVLSSEQQDCIYGVDPVLTKTRQSWVSEVRFPSIQKLFKDAERSYWTSDHLDTSKDMADWGALSPTERKFLEDTLAFFAGADGIVAENLVLNFYQEVPILEVRRFMGFQIAIESVHQEVYQKLIDSYISDPRRKREIMEAIDGPQDESTGRGGEVNEAIKEKADWAVRWMQHPKAPFAVRILAFAAVEGIFFSSSFASLCWLRKRGIIPGLTFMNELISRDEALHVKAACEVFKILTWKPSVALIHALITEAVEVEINFCENALPVRLMGINSVLMSKHIMYGANMICKEIGYPVPYPEITEEPIEWMVTLGLNGYSNFFERENSNYSISREGGSTGLSHSVASSGRASTTDSSYSSEDEDNLLKVVADF